MYKKNKYKIRILFLGLLFSQISFGLAESNSTNRYDKDMYMFPEFRRKTDALLAIIDTHIFPIPSSSEQMQSKTPIMKKDVSNQSYSESWHAFKKAQNDEKAMLAREERNAAERDYLVKLYTDVLVPVSKQGYEKAKEFGSYASKEISKKIAVKKEQYKKESHSVIRQKDEQCDQPPQEMLAMKDGALEKVKEFILDVSAKWAIEEENMIQQNLEIYIPKNVLDNKQKTFQEPLNDIQNINNNVNQNINDRFAKRTEKIKQAIESVIENETVNTKMSNKALLLQYLNQHKIASGIAALGIGFGIGYIWDVLYTKYGEQWKVAFKRLICAFKNKIYQRNNTLNYDETIVEGY